MRSTRERRVLTRRRAITIGRRWRAQELLLLRARDRRATPGLRSSPREASPHGAFAAQPGDRLFARGVAGQVVAAEALDGQDPPGAKQESAPERLLPWRHRAKLGAAVGAGDRLGVEAAVASGPRTRRGSARTSRSRPSSCSGGRRGLLDDREAGAALGAVDERVAVAAVPGSNSSREALVAGGDIGRDQRRRRTPRALLDAEARAPSSARLGSVNRPSMRASEGASLVIAADEPVERAPLALGLDDHPVRRH